MNQAWGLKADYSNVAGTLIRRKGWMVTLQRPRIALGRPLEIKYVDLNGDGVIDKDEAPMATPLFPASTMALRLHFSTKASNCRFLYRGR